MISKELKNRQKQSSTLENLKWSQHINCGDCTWHDRDA